MRTRVSDTQLPPEWEEVTNPEFVDDKYDPRPVTAYRREADDVSVRVLPATTNTAHDDNDVYQVRVAVGEQQSPDRVDRVADDVERDAALDAAAAFAEAYESRDATGADAAAAAVDATRSE